MINYFLLYLTIFHKQFQNEMLTPTMKIKRGNVDKMYMDKYDEWHHSDKKIIWE